MLCRIDVHSLLSAITDETFSRERLEGVRARCGNIKLTRQLSEANNNYYHTLVTIADVTGVSVEVCYQFVRVIRKHDEKTDYCPSLLCDERALNTLLSSLADSYK